jgi:hypothetical protein
LSPVSTDFEADRSSSNISENRFFFKLTNSFIDIEHEHEHEHEHENENENENENEGGLIPLKRLSFSTTASRRKELPTISI